MLFGSTLTNPILNLENIGRGIYFLWLLVLSFYLIRAVRHYQRLTLGVNKKDLQSILENLLGETAKDRKRIDELFRIAEETQKKGLLHIQKVGLVRFNPFKDTGGDQSFTLALLDGEGDGIVVSSLHSRTGTRVYAKPILKEKADEHQLSKEEKEAVEKAIKNF
jgi:hypothetical protein